MKNATSRSAGSPPGTRETTTYTRVVARSPRHCPDRTTAPRARWGWTDVLAPPRELLPRVEQPLGIERPLDRLVHGDRLGSPLALERAALDQPDAVLARDRAAERAGECEQVLGCSL